MSNNVKTFDILAISLNILHNYFDSLTKLFSDPYLTKFLDTSAKLFFSCNSSKILFQEYRLKNRSFLIIKVIKGDITIDNFFYHETKKTQLVFVRKLIFEGRNWKESKIHFSRFIICVKI